MTPDEISLTVVVKTWSSTGGVVVVVRNVTISEGSSSSLYGMYVAP